MSAERQGKWYYYASERGCMSDPDHLDEIGIGFDKGRELAELHIGLVRFQDQMHPVRYSMVVRAHCDQWKVFTVLQDVLKMLSDNRIPSGEMVNDQPFYNLRREFEKLGYKNLGRLRD